MVQDRPDPASLSSPAVSSIGVVGGGQLALMLAQEAPGLGLQLHLQAASASDPAVTLASSFVLGDPDDVEATAALARRCQVITFENEWVPLEALQGLRQGGVRFLLNPLPTASWSFLTVRLPENRAKLWAYRVSCNEYENELGSIFSPAGIVDRVNS